MYKIIPVTSKKQLRQFVNFQIDLYEGCDYFVPPMYSDEMSILDPKKSVYIGKYNDAQCFLCVDEHGKAVGRVCGVISHLYNAKIKENRVRITRFDAINDMEVASLLLKTVEDWGRERGAEVIHGPLGFNDMEREGLMVEGFDKRSTSYEQYYYSYYQDFFDALGYKKEVDWLEFQFSPQLASDDRIAKLNDAIAKRIKVHELKIDNVSKFIDERYDQIFDVLDEAFDNVYGTVPITPDVRKGLLSQFKLVLNKNLISILADENDKIVAVGIMLPSIADALHKTRGKLFPMGWLEMLKDIKNFDVIEMALIGINKEYQGKGATAIMFKNCVDRINKAYPNLKYCETNIMLEDNYKVLKIFKSAFNVQPVRRRRSYYKSLNGKPVKVQPAVDFDAPLHDMYELMAEVEANKKVNKN